MSRHEQWRFEGRTGELYERHLVPAIFGPWAATLVEVAALRAGERVLDVACGTGVVTRLAARHVGSAGHVTGVDLNSGMLAIARSLPPVGGASITWAAMNAAVLDLADASFDVVTCQQGFQFFPEKRASLHEMCRVLVPRGRIVLSIWRRPNAYNIAMADAADRYIGSEAAAILRATRDVPDVQELHRLITDAGFHEVQIRTHVRTTRLPRVEEFVQWHLAATPVAAAVAALSDEKRRALATDVGRALKSYADRDDVAFPDESSLITAQT